MLKGVGTEFCRFLYFTLMRASTLRERPRRCPKRHCRKYLAGPGSYYGLVRASVAIPGHLMLHIVNPLFGAMSSLASLLPSSLSRES